MTMGFTLFDVGRRRLGLQVVDTGTGQIPTVHQSEYYQHIYTLYDVTIIDLRLYSPSVVHPQ
jgi:hypothetical protein